MTQQVYLPTLERMESDQPDFYRLDLLPILLPWLPFLPEDKPCNLFFTTMALREYHYFKQKNNGFYHIQALNLPFQNIEFYNLVCQLD